MVSIISLFFNFYIWFKFYVDPYGRFFFYFHNIWGRVHNHTILLIGHPFGQQQHDKDVSTICILRNIVANILTAVVLAPHRINILYNATYIQKKETQV